MLRKEEEKIESQERGIRNFRKITEVENFYRFVHENSLREEAQKVLKVIVAHQKALLKKKKRRGRKKKQKVLQ